jgi:hypothetical protein
LSTAAPVELSAQRLHELACQAFRVGNRGRLSLCDALRVLAETRLFLDLGFPSLAAYAGAFFQLRRAETFEHVRVAGALLELTLLRDAFAEGRLGWSILKAVTRVASVDSQASWIDYAREHGLERTLAEARDALRRGRDAPRAASFGLPNLDQKLVLRFPRSDMDKVRRWIEGTCAAIAETTGADEVSLEQALLYLCERDSASAATQGARRPPARAQIVYQRCTDCGRARMGTRDGFVEVESQEVERYEGSAEAVVLDGPTPPGLRRRILAREAGGCGNPRCSHRADHCHHVVFRSQGGRTDLANEVAVCATCHALIHAGLLRVSRSSAGDLCWLPVVDKDSLNRKLAANRTTAAQMEQSAIADSTKPASTPPQSAIADSTKPASASPQSAIADSGVTLNLEDIAYGLVRLGVPIRRSRKLVNAAAAALPRSERTEASVLRRSLALI